MHTVIVIGAGFALLVACLVVGRLCGATLGAAASWFLPLWFIGAGINLYIGVKRAGYSVAEEAPIFLVVFAVPAAVALGIWWKLR